MKSLIKNLLLIARYKRTANIFLFGFVILFVLIEARGEGDFKIFLSASRDLFHGKNIYQILYNDWFHYYYSVLFAILLYPLTYLPLYLAKAIWLLLNVFFVKRIWLVIENWLPIYLLDEKSKFIFITLSFIFVSRFLLDNFHLSQMTIFILYLTLEGLNYVFENKLIIGSLLLAVGIDVKLLPVIFVAYLLYRNNWKACVYIIVFFIALCIVPSLFIGFENNKFLLFQRWSLINPFNAEHVLDTSERSFHSITTLLSVLLVEDCGDYHALNLKRNIANISLQKLSLIINAARLILIMCSLYFINSKPFQYSSSKIQTLYEISYICILIPLIFPHQQHYAFFFIFPAITYLMFFTINKYFNHKGHILNKQSRRRKFGIIISLCLVYLLTSSHFILGQFNDYYDHFKTLTYGVLYLIILLGFCRPSKLNGYSKAICT